MLNPDFEHYDSSVGKLSIRRSSVAQLPRRETEIVLKGSVMDIAVTILINRLHHKEQATRFYLMDILREYFKTLEDQSHYYEYIDQFIQSIEYKFIPYGEFVFHAGDIGDYFYLVLKGAAKIYGPKDRAELQKQRALLTQLEQAQQEQLKSTKESKKLLKEIAQLTKDLQGYNDPDESVFAGFRSKYYTKSHSGTPICTFKLVNLMKPGECFGEVSLHQNEARAATVVAATDLHLAALSRGNYHRIFSNKLERLNFALNVLTKTFVAPRETIIQISFDLQRIPQKINTTIFKEGDPVDGIYLINTGQVESVVKSINVKLHVHGQEQFIGLFDLDNPNSIRTYSAVVASHDTVVYYLPLQQTMKLHSNVRIKLLEMFAMQDIEFKKRIKKGTFVNQVQEVESRKRMLKSVVPREIIHQCLKGALHLPLVNSLSQDRIGQIVQYNNNMHMKTERVQENVHLCLQMKDFDKEREFQRKISQNRKEDVPRLRDRPRNFKETVSTFLNSHSQQSIEVSPQPHHHTQQRSRNIHVARIQHIKNQRNLSFKNIEQLDNSLNLHNYTIINLQGNNFKGDQTYIQTLKVQHLNLSYNNLESLWLLPTSLITLEINNNLIQGLANITHLRNIKQIDISNNLLQSVHWFTCIPQLTHLFLKNNKIKSIEPLAQLQSLNEVDLECNEIKSLQDVLILDQLPKINVINLFGNPVLDQQLQLKVLQQLEKNCYCRSLQHYQQSEICRKRSQKNQDDLDIFELDEPQKDMPDIDKKHHTKSLSPLSKVNKNPQFYDPNKANKYVTFQEILKQKQQRVPVDHKLQNTTTTTTNVTINARQQNQSIEQLRQQNKELIQEKFKIQQKLQASIKQNEIFYQEIEGYREQLLNVLQVLNFQQPDQDSNVRTLIDQLEYSVVEFVRESKKQNQEVLNNVMHRMGQKVKLMNSQLEIITMKRFCEFTEKIKNLEYNISRFADYATEQKQVLVKLQRTRLHSPQGRQCQTARHSKTPSDMDQQKFKQLFFKSPTFQNQQNQQQQQERPLKTQGCSQSSSIQQFYLDNIQQKMKQLNK